MSIVMELAAIGLLTLSGAFGFLHQRAPRWSARLGLWTICLGSLLGLLGTAHFFLRGAPEPVTLTHAWLIPWGRWALRLDALSALFLLPIFVVTPLGALYARSYWQREQHPHNWRALTWWYGVLPASMVLVVLAQDSVLFLISWEMMALAAFFLATVDDHHRETVQAGWIYWVATHLGTLCLLAMFLLLAGAQDAAGSMAIAPIGAPAMHRAPAVMHAIFVLGLVGFGVKAGVMPLHVWLPGAHAQAPSHVSAVLSGVMLKMGIYGILRLLSLMPQIPVWWAALLLSLGALSAVLGIVFAAAQRDFKRLLAYSSIENIGIVLMGVGLAAFGRAFSQPVWTVLGLSAALLHVLNHSLFKPLLFFVAGAVLHSTGTRNMDHLGGLIKRMPHTARYAVVGTAAICALPPLNGLAGEFILYVGLLKPTLALGPVAAVGLAVACLALVGAVALLAFVKLYASLFLGTARSEAALLAHEPDKAMLRPMAVLATLCAVVGLLPWSVAPALDLATAQWASADPALASSAATLPALMHLVPLIELGWIHIWLTVALVVAALLLNRLLQRRPVTRLPTWSCGYSLPAARMQYTGTALAQIITGLFAWALRPRIERPLIKGWAPRRGHFSITQPDTLLDGAILPLLNRVATALHRAHVLQQGRSQTYVLYILLAVIALLLIY